MPTLQAPRPLTVQESAYSGKRAWWRSLLLFLLLLLSLALYVVLITVAPQSDAEIPSFLRVWMLCFLPYFASCAFVLATRPVSGRWRWIELAVILAGALVFRAMLLPLPPGLSHDSWRYLWDARVTLHGYSPYVYPPENKVFSSLQDFIYDNSRFRTVPTIYPPGAQAIYLLSYLLAPSNLFFLKGIFVGFDMLTCGALAFLLMRKGLDPRRIVIYAWCPLPIVEFAIEGHVDVIAVTFTILAVLTATSNRRGARALTGFLIGMATLAKLYPILLLVAIVRRRDWALLGTCFITIVLAYIPYLILGHGQAFGYFSGYASEQGGNAGVIQLATYALSHALGYKLAVTIVQQHIVDVLVVCGVSLVILVLRLFRSICTEAATIVLIGTVLAISSHVFPWYTTALLPWIVVLIGPMWTRRARATARVRPYHPRPADSRGVPLRSPWGGDGASWSRLAVTMAWYFVCISLTCYFFNHTRDWHVYYEFVYGVVVVGLGIAFVLGLWGQLRQLYKWTLEGKPR